jgi:predicted MFS family arabinose efflux permease
MRWSGPFLCLSATVFAYQFGFAIARAIQSNFFVERLAMRPDEMGLLTTIRELPGLLMVAIAALTMRLVPTRLAAFCLGLMGLGYAAYGLATSFLTVIPGVLIASLGFHTWLTLNNAFALALARTSDTGQTLGNLQAIGFAGALLAMLLVFGTVQTLGYPTSFALAGAALLAGAAIISRFPAHLVRRDEQRLLVRRRYLLFYVLNFLDGCRMEVFQAFGVFLLVKEYGVDVRTITLLLVISTVINMTLSTPVGRLIDRLGERVTLTGSYLALLGLFLGLALVRDRTLAITLYIAYNFLLLFSMGLNTYLKRIAPSSDVRPCLAMGVTTMHISAIILPPIGGLLWQRFGFEAPFLLGAVFIALSALITQRLPGRAAQPQPAVA